MKTKPTAKNNQGNAIDITKNIISACDTLIKSSTVYTTANDSEYYKTCDDIKQGHNTTHQNVAQDSADQLFLNIIKENTIIRRYKTSDKNHFTTSDEETFATLKGQRKILSEEITLKKGEHSAAIEMQAGDTAIYRTNGEIGNFGGIPKIAEQIGKKDSEVKRGLIIMGERSFIDTRIHGLISDRFRITSATEDELTKILARLQSLA